MPKAKRILNDIDEPMPKPEVVVSNEFLPKWSDKWEVKEHDGKYALCFQGKVMGWESDIKQAEELVRKTNKLIGK